MGWGKGREKSCNFVVVLNTTDSYLRDPKLHRFILLFHPFRFGPGLTEKRGWLRRGGGAASEVNGAARFYSEPKSMRADFPLWQGRD